MGSKSKIRYTKETNIIYNHKAKEIVVIINAETVSVMINMCSIVKNIISTDKDIHFTQEILQNQCENEILNLPTNKCVIDGVAIQSKQPLKYKLIIYGNNYFNNSNMNIEKLIGSIDLDLTQSPTFRINNSNQYRLNSEDLKIFYQDYNETNKLYVSLMNMSNNPKLSGLSGEIQINIKISPRL